MYQLELTDAPADLERILALQHVYHSSNVASGEWGTQGFLTMAYTLDQLLRMKGPYRHVVARSDGAVVGYALVMLKESAGLFPFLAPMFEVIEASTFNSVALKNSRYFVMGQVCVDRAFRGQGVFRALYQQLKAQMQADFEVVATEVSNQNHRSLAAHQRVGFRAIAGADEAVSPWRVMAWDWR